MPKKYVVPLTLYSNEEVASRQTDRKAKEIEDIAKYNLANGTHFWNVEQVNIHKQKKSAEEFEKNHPVIASVAKASRDSRDAKTGAIGAEQVRDLYNTGQSELASELNKKYFGSTATGILTVPLAGEFATYGLLGGGARLLGGTATGAAGSFVGNKVGQLGDRAFGTNWMAPTGKIIGGFAGFAPGMNAATGLLRNAAGKGITMRMPQKTFMNLREQYFDNALNKINAKSDTTDELLRLALKSELTDGESFVHVSPNLITETSFVENPYAAKLGSGAERLAAHSKGYNWVPGIHPNSKVNGENKVWVFKGEPYRMTANDNTYIQVNKDFPVESAPQRNAFSTNYIPLYKADKILQRNPLTGWFDRIVVDVPKQTSISPQQAATTYHFDPRVKRISVLTDAEIEGRPKFMRNQFKLTPEQRRTVLNDANDFARKYGYQEIPDTPDALQQIQNMYRRHNTFVRSVPKSRVEVDPEYGLSPIDWPKGAENLTEQERAYIAATKGYPAQMQDRVFVSSTPESVKYYGDQIGDYNFAVRRPISLGHDPLQWRSRAEFNIEGPITGYTTPTSIFRADNLSDPKFELMLGTGNLSAKPLISETQITGAFNSPANEPLIGWLQQQGYKLPRKHLQGEDAVQMFKEYGAQYPETTRLYRITGTSGKFSPSPDGTAEFAGQWFTTDPTKTLGYGSETVKRARIAKVENPIELQVVDIPNSQLNRYKAKNILKGRSDIEYEPTEDFLIPLDIPRGRAPIILTGNRLADSHASLPQISTQDTPLMQQLRKYVPEARERYGLVGNTNITDDEIAGSLYKKALELGGDTAAVNEVGEPLILFRGDTKRFPALRKVAEPESLAKGTGSMDNSFGNLFLGQLDGPGEGVERYIHYVHQYPGGATEVYPSATGERLVWNGNKIREQGADINIPEKYLSYDISEPFNQYGQQIRRRKISSELAKPNSNDINAFVIRTPSIRNASSEISPEMGGEFIDINGVPKFKNSSYVDRNQSATRIRQILTDAESKGQGLLKSDAYSPLRENEHFEFDYYALPNFNIRNAKHLLPYDFRIKPQWESRLIYRKQGGTLKAQSGTFKDFWDTLPSNQKDSSTFNIRRYWELNGKPKGFWEAFVNGMYTLGFDGKYHANSVAYNKDRDEYEFMKKPNHKTLQLELDEYNRNSDFNSKYKLNTLNTPWKYVKK